MLFLDPDADGQSMVNNPYIIPILEDFCCFDVDVLFAHQVFALMPTSQNETK
jgi:hypothetical protein